MNKSSLIKKKSAFISAAILGVGIFSYFPNAETNAAANTTIYNDTFWKDTSGKNIYSQGGGIFKFGDTYYWYGVHYIGNKDKFKLSPEGLNNADVCNRGDGITANDTVSSNDISSKYHGQYTEIGSTLTGSKYTLKGKTAGECSWRPAFNYAYTAKSAAEAKSYCEKYSGPQSSASNMTYASLAKAGYTSLYNYGGAAETAKLHCFTDTAKTTLNNTHLSNAGAYKIASMIADETKKLGLSLGELRK